jgi:hypothetical protein
MDGVLDADNDLLPEIDPGLGMPWSWYKTTICCFRLSELVRHYQDEGWEVRPLLVVRDLRDIWASLASKPYARNGITAEDPPLRVRLRRFLDDWRLFQRMDWPVLRYETLVADPQPTLREACDRLGLPWNDAMLTWPKGRNDIAHAKWGNRTFWATRGSSLAETLSRHNGRATPRVIAADDLEWLEREFREFNLANQYPSKMELRESSAGRSSFAIPSFEATRRYEWETKRKPIRWLLSRLGIPYRRLILRRSVRKRAT